jgi:hypothetical protein
LTTIRSSVQQTIARQSVCAFGTRRSFFNLLPGRFLPPREKTISGSFEE